MAKGMFWWFPVDVKGWSGVLFACKVLVCGNKPQVLFIVKMLHKFTMDIFCSHNLHTKELNKFRLADGFL